ncbi:hypothetical protein V8E52_011089 [Russula decolorans]
MPAYVPPLQPCPRLDLPACTSNSCATLALCYMDNTTTLLNHLKRQSLTLLPLQHLRIEASFFGELELVRLPSWTSSLTMLGLVDVEDAFSSLIKSLSAPTTTTSWICPKLETLSLDGCTTLDWDALILLCASVKLKLKLNDDDTAATAPNTLACASDIARTLAIGTTKHL